MLLKKELGLTDIQFCGVSKISTATLNKIKNDEEITQKIVFAILDAGFNVNKEWLLTGKGKMFADEPKAESKSFDPARDTLYNEMKSQVSFYREQIGFLNELIKQLTGGKPLKSFPLTFNIPTTKVGLNVRA